MPAKSPAAVAIITVLALHAAAARSAECEVTIEANDMMQFDQSQLKLPAACPQVALTLKHVGSYARGVMGHDWVLTRSEDMAAVIAAGTAAGLRNDFQPADDPRILASTKVIGGGESTTIRFGTENLKAGTAYAFFCTYPGHSSMMQGRLLLEDRGGPRTAGNTKAPDAGR